MSVFLEKGATLLAALPNNTAWRPRNESCSSYPARVTCRGNPSSGPGRMDERHSGYEPLLGGWNVTDVHITGNNGTIAGQGDFWWAAIKGHGPCAKPTPAHWCNLPHGRPHAVLFSRSQRVIVSNLTITQSPFCPSHVLRFCPAGRSGLLTPSASLQGRFGSGRRSSSGPRT